MEENELLEYVNEAIGTFILVWMGVGSVAVSVYTGAYGLFGVGILWAFAVAFGVYWAGTLSSAHLNPAVTLPQALFLDFEWRKVPGYIISQMIAAIIAGFTIFETYWGYLSVTANNLNLTVGEPGSSLLAMGGWTLAPNPAFSGIGKGGTVMADVTHIISLPGWFLSEMLVTFFLVAVIFALIDSENPMGAFGANNQALAGWLIGMLVGALVMYEAPISMTALNPVRDLGPRIAGLFYGFGEIAFPGPRGGWWIPTVSTLVGGILGGGAYKYLSRSAHDYEAEV